MGKVPLVYYASYALCFEVRHYGGVVPSQQQLGSISAATKLQRARLQGKGKESEKAARTRGFLFASEKRGVQALHPTLHTFAHASHGASRPGAKLFGQKTWFYSGRGEVIRRLQIPSATQPC